MIDTDRDAYWLGRRFRLMEILIDGGFTIDEAATEADYIIKLQRPISDRIHSELIEIKRLKASGNFNMADFLKNRNSK